MNKQKNNAKGITLVALVITIIVLVILVGVTLSVTLNTGLINNSKTAVSKYSEEQSKEEQQLKDYEIIMDLKKSNSEYKVTNGCITGIKSGATIKELKESFKPSEGYEIADINNENLVPETVTDQSTGEEKDNILTTGMVVRKNGIEVARIVIFGDVDCSGMVTGGDTTELSSYLGFPAGNIWPYYKRLAANVYEDDELNNLDHYKLQDIIANDEDTSTIFSSSIQILKRHNKKIQEYINQLPDNCPYNFAYNEEEDSYTLKGVKSGETVGDLKQYLGDTVEIKKKPRDTETTDETVVTSSHKIYMTVVYQYKIIDEETGEEFIEELSSSIPFSTIEV